MLFHLLLILLPFEGAAAQSKFFSTPSRGGAEGAKQNAQLTTLHGEFVRMNACTAQGRIYGPAHPNADTSGCIEGLRAWHNNGPIWDFSDGGAHVQMGIIGGTGAIGTFDAPTDFRVLTNSANRLIVKGDGNVGIGTASPSYRLDVNGDIAAGTNSWIRTRGATGWHNDTYGGGWFMQDATWIRSNGGKRVYMEAGIDTAAASGIGCSGGMGAGYMLRVCGTTFINGSTYTMGDMYVGGTGHGGSGNALFGSNGDVWMPFRGQWLSAALSDRRIKENIQAMPDGKGLKTIMKLKPVTFDWRDVDRSKRYGTQIGFVAQDVEEVYPSIIDTGVTPFKIKTTKGDEEVEGVKSIRYEMLVVPLVQSVQELKANNDDQAARIDKLLGTVEAQGREIKALQAELLKGMWIKIAE
jgi:hypothetical protein